MIGLFKRLLNDAVEAGMRIFQALVLGILTAPLRALFGAENNNSDDRDSSPSSPDVLEEPAALPAPADEAEQTD
ncbi:MAG: hypothetical protein GWP91_08815 [Rhodobacterales bacterium]|nr:hypothetical protein [Rhodobacterales bacterium]